MTRSNTRKTKPLMQAILTDILRPSVIPVFQYRYFSNQYPAPRGQEHTKSTEGLCVPVFLSFIRMVRCHYRHGCH